MKRLVPIIVIIAVFGAILSLQLNQVPLNNWDECIYAQYAKEMQATGNFLTYQWNNRLILEKPPLYGLTLQLPFAFGVTQTTARLPSLVSGLLLSCAVFLFCRRYFSPSVAIMATLLLFIPANFVELFYRVNTDIGFTLFTFVGFCCWVRALRNPRYSYYLSGIFFGLAALNKGLSVLLFLGALGAACLIQTDKKLIIGYIKLIGAFLLTILPWHLYQVVVHGNDFLQVYFWQHIVARITSHIYTPRAWWFYFVLAGRDFFPWYLIAIPAYFSRVFSIRREPLFIKHRDMIGLILIIIFHFVFLSVAQTRLRMYILPIYPYLAIAIAYGIYETASRFTIPSFWIPVSIGILFLAALSTIMQKPSVPHEQDTFENPTSYAVFSAARNYSGKKLRYLVGSTYLTMLESPNKIARHIGSHFAYGDQPCVVFYTDMPTTIEYNPQIFQATALNNPDDLLLINRSDSAVMRGIPARVVYENQQFLLFTNQQDR